MASVAPTVPSPETEKKAESPAPTGPSWRWTLTAPLWIVPIWALLSQFILPTPFTTLVGCMLMVMLAVSSYTDIRWAKIRNTVTYAAVLFAIVIAAFDTVFCRPPLDANGEVVPGAMPMLGEFGAQLSPYLGSVGLLLTLGGAAVGFLVMVIVYHIAGGGAGDVKIATAIGAFVGPYLGWEIILWTYVSAGLAIVVWLVVALGPVTVFEWLYRKIGARFVPTRVAPPEGEKFSLFDGKIRLAPFFTIGTLLVLGGINSLLRGYAGM